MATPPQRPDIRIGLLGHHGNQNLGDEVTFQAVIANIRLRLPDAEIICFSNNPADTAWRHGVPAYPVTRNSGRNRTPDQQVAEDRAKVKEGAPESAAGDRGLRDRLKRIPGLRRAVNRIRKIGSIPRSLVAELRFLAVSRSRVRDLDVLIVTGSNQFLDSFGGVWLFPYSMLKWAMLAKSTKTRFAVLSVGAGPLYSPISRLFVQVALAAADHASFRDRASRDLVARSWCGQTAKVFPDLAFSLPSVPEPEPEDRSRSAKPVVAINPMPVNDPRYWYVSDELAYRCYVESMVDLCGWLDEQGYPWFMYAMQPKDQNVIADIFAGLQHRGKASESLRSYAPATVDELLVLLKRSDLVVATRFHAAALAMLVCRPVLGICYERKTSDLLAHTRLSEFALNIHDVTGAELIHRLQQIAEERDGYRLELEELVSRLKQQLDTQYSELFPIMLAASAKQAECA